MKRWMKVVERPRPAKATESQNAAIISACGAFIRDVLKPRFLPEIKPNEFNYAVDGPGAWLNNAIPSVQSHYRTFIPTTNCSAPVPRIGTLILADLAAWTPPFTSGRQVLTFRTRA